MGLLDNNIVRFLRSKNAVSSASYALDNVSNFLTIPNDAAYGAALVVVTSLTNGGTLSIVTDSPTRAIRFYNAENGEMLDNITSVGRYYVPINGIPVLYLRNSVAITDGSVSLYVRLIDEVPESVLLRKPIQLIATANIALSTSLQTIINDLKISDYKYYFISYEVRNGNAVATRIVTINAQPYHKYPYTAETRPGLSETIVDEQNSYSFQTNWQQIRGERIRIFVKEASHTDGDIIYMNLYGVR